MEVNCYALTPLALDCEIVPQKLVPSGCELDSEAGNGGADLAKRGCGQ